MLWTAWITLAALVIYQWISFNAGKARGTFKIPAPAMDGPLEFQCIQRVHANTVKQIVVFLPALWLCAMYFSDPWAALGGAVWCGGRVVYALGYYKSPAKRDIGFGITFLATIVLMLGAAIGLVIH